jgi:tRNA A-37 threonylcarbamoyl transferase component Bud32
MQSSERSSSDESSIDELLREVLARLDSGTESETTIDESARARLTSAVDHLRQEWSQARSSRAHGSGAVPSSAAIARTSTASELIDRLAAHTPKQSRYRIDGEIARGGMGAILRVWDEDLRRPLAMKVALEKAKESATSQAPAIHPRVLARFLEEAQITGQLDHPSIVPVHELGLDSQGRVYFTMRLVKGEELRSVFEKSRLGIDGWNLPRALGVLLKVCEAMAYAHSKGVIHRDLKPSNVMVGKYGEVYVMDWGLARVAGSIEAQTSAPASLESVRTSLDAERQETPDSPLLTMVGDVVGTPSFMSPEQARGRIDELGPQSDVYSLGAMLYQLLTGEMPYVPGGTQLTQQEVLSALMEAPPRPIREVAPQTPSELVAICERAMARDRAQRYATVAELLEDLHAYFERGLVGARRSIAGWVRKVAWVLAAITRLMPLGLVIFVLLFVLASRDTAKASQSFGIWLPFQTNDLEVRAPAAAPWVEAAAVREQAGLIQLRLRGMAPKWIALGALACVWLACWYFVVQLKAVFDTMREGTPFVAGNVRRLRKIAALLVLLAVAKTALSVGVMGSLGRSVEIQGVPATLSLDPSYSLLLSAVLVFLIAQVFRLGVELERAPGEPAAR